MWALSFIAFRSSISNRLRTSILIVAVLLGVGGLSAVQLTNDAMARGLEQAWRTTVGISDLQVRSFPGSSFSDATLDQLRRLPEVVGAAPVARKRVFFRIEAPEGFVQLIQTDPDSEPQEVVFHPTRDRGFVELIGVDPETEPSVRSYRLQDGAFLSPGRPDGVVTRVSWAQEHQLRVGDQLELITRDGPRDFELIGTLATDEAGIAAHGPVVLVGLDTARRAFGMEDRVSAISVQLRAGETPVLRDAIARVISERHLVRRAEDVRADLAKSVAELQGSLTLFGATTLFVAIFLIVNTIEMTVVSQTQLMGRLRAAGATRSQITGYFLVHGLVPGALGSVAGVGAGYLLAGGLAAWIARSEDVAVAPIAFSAEVTALGVVLGLATVAGASVWPAVRAARSDLIAMAQGESETAGRVDWRIVGTGLALMGLAIATLLVTPPGTGRPLQAAALFPLLVGVVLVSRSVVRPMGVIFDAILSSPRVGRVSGMSQRLAARNLVRHIGRTTLTVAGFMVSVSLLVALSAVATGAVRAGERWAHALIAGDYAVVSPVDQPPVFIAEFAKLSGVRYASPVGFFNVQSGPTLLQVASIEPEIFVSRLEFVEGSAPEATIDLNQGGAVLIPIRLARERALHVRDTLPLQAGPVAQNFRVAGVVAHSFPSPDGARTVLMGREDAVRVFDQRSFRLLMIEGSGSDAARVKADVGELAERYGMSAVTAQEIAAEVALALWRLLMLLGALVGIGLIVGAFGTANTMLMNIAERSRELSILWSGGMSRVQLQVMAVAEAAMMGLIGGILGAAIGGALGWLFVILSRTSGFQPEYAFPLPAAAAGIALAVLAASLAALGPARRMGQFEGLQEI